MQYIKLLCLGLVLFITLSGCATRGAEVVQKSTPAVIVAQPTATDTPSSFAERNPVKDVLDARLAKASEAVDTARKELDHLRTPSVEEAKSIAAAEKRLLVARKQLSEIEQAQFKMMYGALLPTVNFQAPVIEGIEWYDLPGSSPPPANLLFLGVGSVAIFMVASMVCSLETGNVFCLSVVH